MNNENLKPPWKKGDPSPNPKGRPKGPSIANQLKKIIRDSEGTGQDIAKAMAQAAIKHALQGDFRYFKEIVDRIDGPMKSGVSISGESMKIEFVDLEKPEDYEPPEPPKGDV